ncbi:hypothetical protein Aduo_018125 [Ancylostoma duodenale]
MHKNLNNVDGQNNTSVRSQTRLKTVVLQIYVWVLLSRGVRFNYRRKEFRISGEPHAPFSFTRTETEIQPVSMVIEVCRAYRLPLVLTFVDYEKAFDNVETNAILSAVVDQGIDASYVRTLADCHNGCSTTIQLFQRRLTIPIAKGARQGDTVSPKLFTEALQWAMRSLD